VPSGDFSYTYISQSKTNAKLNSKQAKVADTYAFFLGFPGGVVYFIVVSSPPSATEEAGTMGREIESGLGIGR
jgi:hypothetical protein